MRGYIVPEVYQNEISAIKKLQTTSRVKFVGETVTDISNSPPTPPSIDERTDIPHNGNFASEENN